MDNRVGTAEWIDPSLVAERYPFHNGAFWLGRTIDRHASPVGVSDDRHILIVGGTRGGKGTTFLINNLCRWPGSAIVIDPKGENATVTAARRGPGGEHCQGMGQNVHVLDPYNVAQVPEELRGCFNPLDWISGEDDYATKKVERLATSLIPFKEKDEDYWDNEARGLLGALILHVATDPMYEGKRTLMTVRDLVMRGDVTTYELAEQEGEYIDPPLHLLWEMMILNEICHGYVRDVGTYFRDMVSGSSKQWLGVRGAVKVATDFINSAGMRKSLEQSSFSFKDLKSDEKGATVYLSIPQDFINTDRGWMRMMVDILTTEAKLTSGQPASGYPILMMLDEFAGLDRMDVLEQSIAQLAGYGVKMVCVVQNLPQLKQVYKDSWETFVSGAGVKIFFANEDHFTREYVSKLAGETEVIREGVSSNKSQAENESFTEGTSHTEGTSTNQSSSTNTNFGRGKGWHIGLNRGSNDSVNYGRQHGLGALFPSATGTSEGRGGGLNVGINRNKNWSRGSTTTKGTSTNQSETENFSMTRGRTMTHGSGTSEHFHKRFLVEPHDVGFKFARVDDLRDPRYPGVALVMVSGERPMPIRKCNYFEDPAFVDCFEPHPDHEFRPLTALEREHPFLMAGAGQAPFYVIEVRTPSQELLGVFIEDHFSENHTTLRVRVLVEEGEKVKRGDVIASFIKPYVFAWAKEEPPEICSPVDGWVYSVPIGMTGKERSEDEVLLDWYPADAGEKILVIEPRPETELEEVTDEASDEWDNYADQHKVYMIKKLVITCGTSLGIALAGGFALDLGILPIGIACGMIGIGLLACGTVLFRMSKTWLNDKYETHENETLFELAENGSEKPSFHYKELREQVLKEQEARQLSHA